MTNSVLDRETLLDSLVNVVPLAILVFFALLFLVLDPWGGSLLGRVLQMALIVVPFAILLYVTYETSKRI